MKKIIGPVLIVGVLLSGCSNKNSSTPTNPDEPFFAKGADVSWVTEMEAAGVKFYNSNGVEQACMQILKDKGMNSIRLRAWVNPAKGWNNTKDVVVKAKRAKNLGMKLMIDFHYADDWADPGKQPKPDAWSSLSFTDLKTALYNYTKGVMDTLKMNDLTPDWVQVGNETNDGMLWEDGRASKSMGNFAQLVKSGYDAVKAVSPATLVIVHLSNGFDNSLFRWMFDGLKQNGATLDIIGMSLYPSYAPSPYTNHWDSVNQQCLLNMKDMVSRYQTPVMIVEVGMPYDQPGAAKSFIADIIAKTKSLSNNMGLGVFYWEPECYNKWNGYTLGAFDNSGKPTIALDAFAN
jgi:arabinogalactan endo-1,4-beta-galactosidase